MLKPREDVSNRPNVPHSKRGFSPGPDLFGDSPIDLDYRVVRKRLDENRNPARPEHAPDLANGWEQLHVTEDTVSEHAEGSVGEPNIFRLHLDELRPDAGLLGKAPSNAHHL